VREGRAARLAAVQQHMADGSSNRDQQLLEAGGRASAGRLSPGRNALRGIGGRDGRGRGSSPARFSRAGRLGSSPGGASAAGRLGSSPGRSAAALPSGRAAVDRDSRLSFGTAAATPSWQIASGSTTPEPATSEAQRLGNASSSVAAGARRQSGQSSSLTRGMAAAAASLTEQQDLWSGARSAPEDAAAPAGGARGLLLPRGAQPLEPISTSGGSPGRRSTGSRGGAEPAASPSGSDAGGAPLLPYGADSSMQG
jgi:hypothetical protein